MTVVSYEMKLLKFDMESGPRIVSGPRTAGNPWRAPRSPSYLLVLSIDLLSKLMDMSASGSST